MTPEENPTFYSGSWCERHCAPAYMTDGCGEDQDMNTICFCSDSLCNVASRHLPSLNGMPTVVVIQWLIARVFFAG